MSNDVNLERLSPYEYQLNFSFQYKNEPIGIIYKSTVPSIGEYGPYIKDELIRCHEMIIEALEKESGIYDEFRIDWV